MTNPVSRVADPAFGARSSAKRTVFSFVAAVTAALALTFGGVVTAAPAQAASSDIVSSSTRTTDAQRLLSLINAHRAARGLAPVKYSAQLSGIAQGQSDRLVREEVINHSNTFLTDGRAAGYNAAGEIHALSYQNSVANLMNWWKGSPAHNKVLTDPRMKVVGIGLTYTDGKLSRTGQPWRLVGTVTSYGFPSGGAPADTSSTVAPVAMKASAPVVRKAPARVVVRGHIKTRYDSMGGARVLGKPTANERRGRIHGGVTQRFRTTSGVRHKILWSPRSGAHVIKEGSVIGRGWARAGYERGWGYPTTNEYRSGSEMRQRFSNGYVAHVSRTTGKMWITR